jgi:rare lipoprotein A
MIMNKYILLLACLSILSSCSTARKEGYRELPAGKTYAVASWYGPKFHGRPTASGEIYDMYKYTCAHKTYPFGLRLNVTLLSTNRSVECIVNDRGPFIKGRDIDLSFAAAKRIGLTGPGVGKVLLENRGRKESYMKKVRIKAIRKTGPFAIQVGAFTERVNAVRLKTALSLVSNKVYIQETFIDGKRFFRVRIGNYNNFDRVVSIAKELGQVGYPVLIVRASVRL